MIPPNRPTRGTARVEMKAKYPAAARSGSGRAGPALRLAAWERSRWQRAGDARLRTLKRARCCWSARRRARRYARRCGMLRRWRDASALDALASARRRGRVTHTVRPTAIFCSLGAFITVLHSYRCAGRRAEYAQRSNGRPGTQLRLHVFELAPAAREQFFS